MNSDFDVCVIGSGAGGGPIAHTLALAGYSVVILEKGPWLRENDFFKDELACCRRDIYVPELRDEQHVLEQRDDADGWQATSTADSGRSLWNGNCVGGSSNFMSGFFHRLRPEDFRQLSEYGPIAGANVADWPITYSDLEPYYTKVEQVVGVSGQHTAHPGAAPRSTVDYPYPPTAEHPISAWIDQACEGLGYHALKVPRAILSHPAHGRRSCEYSGYCGSFGCSSGAKGSARAALLDPAVATGRCQIRDRCKVTRIASDAAGRITGVDYIDYDGQSHTVDAKVYVVACQAIETSRLLLCSTGPKHPQGLANHHGQVGRNLLFSAGGAGTGDIEFSNPTQREQLRVMGPFVNRALDDWYRIDDPGFATRPAKGGIVEFLFEHPNPISKAAGLRWDGDGNLLWGLPLKRKLETWFRTDRTLTFEVFNDWLPTDDCRVTLDGSVKDRWSTPVAKVRLGYHPHDLEVGRYLAAKGEDVLRKLGAVRISSGVSGAPPPNLQAGGCRFGEDPMTSVLDADCRAHDIDNLYITDGSFMPTGGSVPYTWTIYANAFRVADRIRARLGQPV